MLAIAGACAIGLAAPAAAAPGQCFDAAAHPVGPIYDTESPDVGFIDWVQARGGACRALRADEVQLDRGRAYPRDYLSATSPPSDVAPGAARSVPPPVPAPPSREVIWEGDPTLARQLILAYYEPLGNRVNVVDTGRMVRLSVGGTWRVYDLVNADGSRREVAVRMRPDRTYLLIENDGSTWSQAIYLDQ
jgi:hypothetical protein